MDIVPAPDAGRDLGRRASSSTAPATSSPTCAASTTRVVIGYGASMAIGIVVGVLMGSFRSAEAVLEPQIGFLRYIPASALTPLFLLWLGIDETPKVALILVGTVFYNILMVADVARGGPEGAGQRVLHAGRRPAPRARAA